MTCGGARKCKWHRWHLHHWSWGKNKIKNQPSPQDCQPVLAVVNQCCQCTSWLLFLVLFCPHPTGVGWPPNWHLWAIGIHTVTSPCPVAAVAWPSCVAAIALLSHVAAVASPGHCCCITCCCCCSIALLLCHGCCIHTGWFFIGRMCWWCQCQGHLVGCWLDYQNFSLTAIKPPFVFYTTGTILQRTLQSSVKFIYCMEGLWVCCSSHTFLEAVPTLVEMVDFFLNKLSISK